MIRIVTLFLLLVSCGTQIVLPPEAHWDPLLVPFVEDFREDALFYGCSLNRINLKIVERVDKETVRYGQAMGDAVGICTDMTLESGTMNYTTKWHEIWILDSIIDYNKLRDVMYHELGHCYLGLEHSEGGTSIMYETTLSKKTLDGLDWEERKDELFNNCKENVND